MANSYKSKSSKISNILVSSSNVSSKYYSEHTDACYNGHGRVGMSTKLITLND